MPAYRVVMVEPAFEESIGFVARAMKNFGITDLHLVKPLATLTDYGRMRGGHAQDVLDSIVIQDSLSEALEGLDLSVGTTAQQAHSAVNLLRRPIRPEELRKNLANTSGRVGIVLGREGTGLDNDELNACDALVTIPSAPDYGTLNISHAAAIVFYELYKASELTSADKLASEDVKAVIAGYLSEALRLTGREEYKVRLTVRALRNVMGRSGIRRREASLIAGAFREISEELSRSLGGERLPGLDQTHPSATSAT